MNYYQARQRKPDGRWHYTKMRDESIWPIGYCADPAKECHEKGHATAEEAEECYRSYLLDTQLDFDGRSGNAMYRCRKCDAFTMRYAKIKGTIGEPFFLCDAHRNRESMATLIGSWKRVIASV